MSQPITSQTRTNDTDPRGLHPGPLINQDQPPADVVQAVDVDVQPMPPLPVTVTDPARVIEMPAKNGGALNRDLSTTNATKILDRDPRRKRAIIVLFDTGGTSDGAFIGATQAEANSDLGFLHALSGPNIAAGNVVSAPLEITSMDELWARAFTAACKCSVWIERWSD